MGKDDSPEHPGHFGGGHSGSRFRIAAASLEPGRSTMLAVDELRPALLRAAEQIATYRAQLREARVKPWQTREEVAAALDSELPGNPMPLREVIEQLVAGAEPGLMASAGPRYFGFV